jgi:hypothetical protein
MRPTKFDAKTATRIVRSLRNGNTKDDAARAGGIDPATFYRWQAGNASFARRVEAAIDAVNPKLVAIVHGAAFKGDIAAARWLLERRMPSIYSKVTRVEGGDPERPIKIDPGEEVAHVAKRLAGLSDADLRALVRKSPGGN